MAPIEDLQARDLAWISDFVMQQMVIMLRPMMDHLQQTDAAVDYTQRAVQRLSMDISEVRGDVERTNKYLSILRQGLGVQNEGKCMLQRGLESTVRTVKRLDDQVENVLTVMRAIEDSIAQLSSDGRVTSAKQEDLGKQIGDAAVAVEEVQAKAERFVNDTRSLKESVLNSEARLEVFQRELRELRRNQLSLAQKVEEKGARAPPSASGGRAAAPEPWPQKKSFASVEVVAGAGAGAGQAGRVSSSSGRTSLLHQVWSHGNDAMEAEETHLAATGVEEAHESSRLPVLSRSTNTQRVPDRAAGNEPRLRFSATMAAAKPTSRGAPPG